MFDETTRRTVMTGLAAFASTLLPSFSKSRITEDLNSAFKVMTRLRDLYDGMLTRDYIPVIESNYGHLLGALKGRSTMFRGDLLKHIGMIVDKRVREQGEIMDFADDIFGTVVSTDALDHRRLQMLRYVEGLNYFNLYARKLLIHVNHLRIQDETVVSGLDEIDTDFLLNQANQIAFAMVATVMEHDAKFVRKSLDKVSKIKYTEESYRLMELDKKNKRKMDPLGQNMIPVIGDLVYHLGTAKNLWFKHRQDLNDEEIEKIQIQLLLLKRKRDGVEDKEEIAKLTKQIDYHNSRINKISAKIEDIEED